MSPVSDINAMLRDIRAGGKQWRNQLPPGHLPSAPLMPGNRDIMEAEKQLPKRCRWNDGVSISLTRVSETMGSHRFIIVQNSDLDE
jgi:hypothetical protein